MDLNLRMNTQFSYWKTLQVQVSLLLKVRVISRRFYKRPTSKPDFTNQKKSITTFQTGSFWSVVKDTCFCSLLIIEARHTVENLKPSKEFEKENKPPTTGSNLCYHLRVSECFLSLPVTSASACLYQKHRDLVGSMPCGHMHTCRAL